MLRDFLAILKDATLTALSTSSVNIEVVAGEGDHPALWEIQRGDWSIACTVSDNAPLKDCTAYGAHPGRNHFRIGGTRENTVWVPQNAYKNTLVSDRKSFKWLLNVSSIKAIHQYERLISFSCSLIRFVLNSDTKTDTCEANCRQFDYPVCPTSRYRRLQPY